MKTIKSISAVLYILVALITASLGVRFISASEYFSYHAAAAVMPWSAVDPGLQLVYLAVFRVCGAAILAVALSLLIMIFVPFLRYGRLWSYYAIPIVGMLFWSIVLTTTLQVAIATAAAAPWGGSLFCIVMLLLGFVLSLFGYYGLPGEVH